MPTFLSDPPQTLYLLAGAFAIVSCAVWFGRRDKRSLAVFAAALLLAALVLLLDALFESPREGAEHAVRDISEAVNSRNWDAFDARVSKDFQYKNWKKADLRAKLAEVIGRYDARTAVWEFNRDKVVQTGDDQVELVFDAKGDPKSGPAYYAHFKATLVREPDGVWRLKTLAVYPYASKTNGPEESFPGQ